MLKVNLGNPKAIEAAIRSVSKFASGVSAGLESTTWVHVQSIDNGVRLTATDLLTSVEYAVNSSEVLQDGEFCIPSKNLLGLSKLIKDQSGVSLEQTEKGVSVSLADAPTFKATFKAEPTDEFPMLPETNADAKTITLTSDQVSEIKALAKYASTDHYRVGLNAVQFATHDGMLHAYATDGSKIAYTRIGQVDTDTDFAIPLAAIKKALQVTNTPDLRKSEWRLTIPEEDGDVISIEIQGTVVKSRSADAVDLTDYIQDHEVYEGAADDHITFDPKALASGFKKVSSIFVKDKRFTNVLIIEDRGDRITMTAKPVNDSNRFHDQQQARDMDTEYVHTFDASEAQNRTGNNFHIRMDANTFDNFRKDLMATKPNQIHLQAKYGMPDGQDNPTHDPIMMRVPNSELAFIATPAKL